MTSPQLETWLAGLKPPGPTLSYLDGMLTALVTGPMFVHPDTWLTHIMGRRHRTAATGSKADCAVMAIVQRYNQISEELSYDPKAYVPLLDYGQDGQILPAEWSNGFLQGIAFAITEWGPYFQHPDTQPALTIICGNATNFADDPMPNGQLSKLLNTDPNGRFIQKNIVLILPELAAQIYRTCTKKRFARSE